jgi:NAD(P)-dependent dehydrogenase (short-subunit alcohol dehydrogenase family)
MKSGQAVAAAIAGAVAGWIFRRRRPGYDLRGRTVVITGGSRGLGLVLARAFARAGSHVALLARDAPELARAAQELADSGADVMTAICDVRSQVQVNAAIHAVLQRYGRVDILVNNAGTIQVGPLAHMQLADFHDAMAVHFWGPLYATLAALPHMRRHGSGRIVNISSIGGRIGVPHLAPYCASKFALTGLSDAMRHELRRYGIRVTTVCPGLMRTGSPIHAQFKGRHEEEYRWFSVLGGLPLTSINAERAAQAILRACRRGQARLTLSLAARAALLADAVAPGVTGAALDLLNRALPQATGPHGDRTAVGWESRERTPALLTRLSDRAARRHNETAAFVPYQEQTR